jgi:Uma2 family endonuclease
MSAATLPTPVRPPAVPRPSVVAAVEVMKVLGAGEGFLLNDVSWEDYRWFDAQRDQFRPKVKLVYSDGRLEIVSTSFAHDRNSRRLYGVVMVLGEELNLVVFAGGGFTLDREDLANGVQADECFYIQNAEAVRFVDDIDLTVHPPPDLVVEVDRTSSSIPKEPIYRRMGVPELWRLEEAAVVFRVLQSDGSYATAPTSRAFPLLTATDLTRMLFTHTALDAIAFTRNFRNWVRTLLPQQP